jgi:hypothetical protein
MAIRVVHALLYLVPLAAGQFKVVIDLESALDIHVHW